MNPIDTKVKVVQSDIKEKPKKEMLLQLLKFSFSLILQIPQFEEVYKKDKNLLELMKKADFQ